jgi:tetratricopeptide (TPR) repeat protein
MAIVEADGAHAQSPRQKQGRGMVPGPGAAMVAPKSAEQRDALLAQLYGKLAIAPSADAARHIVASIERLWGYSGSATADLLFRRAIAMTEPSRHDLALKLLTATVELQPDFADAWNRRAYIYYLQDDYERALGDLRRVLALEPNHFKALEGLARILREVGEKKGAREAFKRLLIVHPNSDGAREAVEELTLEIEGRGI